MFSALRCPLGIQLALAKPHILSSMTRHSPHKHLSLSPFNQYFLQRAINFLSTDPCNQSPEVTSGIRFLGYPLGSHAFAKQFLDKSTTKVSNLQLNSKQNFLISKPKDNSFVPVLNHQSPTTLQQTSIIIVIPYNLPPFHS
jgi:hypothetical protein